VKKLIFNILRKAGVDRAISYGIFTRVWGLVAGPVTLLMIATKLTKVQQGYFYTISSLLALQIFFELGLKTVISQFASHEFANLTWGEKGAIKGDAVSRERFIDLLCKSLKGFGIAALLLMIVLVPTGLLFLGKETATRADFAWRIPWILIVFGTGFNLSITPFYAVIMGSGDVVTVNHREMAGAIVSSLIGWAVLGLGGGLYAGFAITSGNIIISWSYLLSEKPELLRVVWSKTFGRDREIKPVAVVSWWGEVWPMQWKIALTWIAGYFVFELFTPVLFHYQGAIIAGQMGMTLSAANSLLAVSLMWSYTKAPEFGKFVARREWANLDRLLCKVIIQSTGVAIFGAVAGWAAIMFLQRFSHLGQRFIPANQAALLFAAICASVPIACLGAYLRAHKQEPFLPLSITLGFVQGWATWYFGKKYSTLGVTSGFLIIIFLFSLPVSVYIWNRCRRKWHPASCPSDKMRYSAEVY
jgi:hypothetical protein